jgi:hypothetical protein
MIGMGTALAALRRAALLSAEFIRVEEHVGFWRDVEMFARQRRMYAQDAAERQREAEMEQQRVADIKAELEYGPY